VPPGAIDKTEGSTTVPAKNGLEDFGVTLVFWERCQVPTGIHVCAKSGKEEEGKPNREGKVHLIWQYFDASKEGKPVSGGG